ncbi:MAG TPA: hypothetical protein VFJ57_01275 [Solirubrobacterales bacterium]|nr:hypothetical protein [Solirubrobacterales bacterium]
MAVEKAVGMEEKAPAPRPDNGSGAPEETPAGPSISLADELAERRREITQEREPLDLPLPGYGPKLVARYRALTYKELKTAAQKVRRLQLAHDEEAELKGLCDTLIAACVGFFTTVDGELVPLQDAMPELADVQVPVRYDVNLARATGLEVSGTPRARQIVREVFGEDTYLISHYQEVEAWMSEANTADDQAF